MTDRDMHRAVENDRNPTRKRGKRVFPSLTLRVTISLAAAMVLPVCLCGGIVRAQDDWDAATKPAERPVQNNRFVVQNGRFAMPDFDQWVLGGKNRDQIENLLKSQLTMYVESANRACTLSAAQREKLRLAGGGDLKQLSRTIDQAREEFREVGNDRQKYSDCINQAQMLQAKMRSGIFGESSLYQKVLRQTLDNEQSVLYERQDRERRKFRYEAKIEMVLSNFENSLALRADQRQRLVKLLLDETEPPKMFGQYDLYVVLFQASSLKDEKLKPILDDAQRQSLKKVFDQYLAPGMVQHLRTQGYLP